MSRTATGTLARRLLYFRFDDENLRALESVVNTHLRSRLISVQIASA